MGKQVLTQALIGFYGTKKDELIRNMSDNLGKILSVEINIEEVDFILINNYKGITEAMQLQILTDFCSNLQRAENAKNKNIIHSILLKH